MTLISSFDVVAFGSNPGQIKLDIMHHSNENNHKGIIIAWSVTDVEDCFTTFIYEQAQELCSHTKLGDIFKLNV